MANCASAAQNHAADELLQNGLSLTAATPLAVGAAAVVAAAGGGCDMLLRDKSKKIRENSRGCHHCNSLSSTGLFPI
jgi:hypothetical protein